MFSHGHNHQGHHHNGGPQVVVVLGGQNSPYPDHYNNGQQQPPQPYYPPADNYGPSGYPNQGYPSTQSYPTQQSYPIQSQNNRFTDSDHQSGYTVVEGIPDGMEKQLESISAIRIEDDYTEKNGCMMINHYKIQDQMGDVTYFKASQSSECCDRVWCAACRPYHMQIKNNGGVVLATAEKECGCCFCDPEVKITGEGGRTLGYVRDPGDCCSCDQTFSIAGPDGKNAVLISGSTCQSGLCCPMPCCCCKEVNFSLYDFQRGVNAQSKLGTLDKTNDCCGVCCQNESSYQIVFGSIERADWRFLVMSSALYIQFRQFYQAARHQ